MISIMRSQKANDYQVTMGLFLLGSGASKREMEVLAHAGLSLSYTSIITHVRKLSKEGTAKYKQIVREKMCSLTWDNLNIPFRVGEQRLGSGNHFDNGTTATLIPLYDPSAPDGDVPLGSLPLSMKPPRTTCRPVVEWPIEHVLPSPEGAAQLTRNCLWQIQRMALQTIEDLAHLRPHFQPCPTVKQIPVHKTSQYPLPAMNLDESSIDGTIRVYTTILSNLDIWDGELHRHGLMFTDGDLLTDSLVDKVTYLVLPSAAVYLSITRLKQQGGTQESQ